MIFPPQAPMTSQGRWARGLTRPFLAIDTSSAPLPCCPPAIDQWLLQGSTAKAQAEVRWPRAFAPNTASRHGFLRMSQGSCLLAQPIPA